MFKIEKNVLEEVIKLKDGINLLLSENMASNV